MSLPPYVTVPDVGFCSPRMFRAIVLFPATALANQADQLRRVRSQAEGRVLQGGQVSPGRAPRVEALLDRLQLDHLVAHEASLPDLPSRGIESIKLLVYSCCGFLNTWWTSPTSTSRPSYITATLSTSCACTPMSCTDVHRSEDWLGRRSGRPASEGRGDSQAAPLTHRAAGDGTDEPDRQSRWPGAWPLAGRAGDPEPGQQPDVV